jgi:hypothetical protein
MLGRWIVVQNRPLLIVIGGLIPHLRIMLQMVGCIDYIAFQFFTLQFSVMICGLD